MATIAGALARIKEDVGRFLPAESIEAACVACGHRWRERALGPVTTVHLFVLQVLHFNAAIAELRRLAKVPFAAGSYGDARKRLPLAALQSLLRRSAEAPRPAHEAGGGAAAGCLWHGLRALLVDGSSAVVPDTPALCGAFGRPSGQKAGCGFPVAKVLGLFDALSGLVVEMLPLPLFTHDMSKAVELHPLLGAGDLLVGDRGLCSFAHLALLHLRRAAGLFRVHQAQIVDFRPHRKAGGKGRPKGRFVRRLGHWDQLVDWVKPQQRPGWMTAAQYALLPRTLRVRELRYRIPRKGQRTLCVTIATTLLDPLPYPADAVRELYGLRWTVETHLAELKTTLRMGRLKCRTPEGVKKELAAYCLVYNLVHAVMLEAARRQGVDPARISFIDAVRWLQNAEPGEQLPELVVNPERQGRHEPRVTKTRHGSFPVMTRPRAVLRKALKKQAKSA
jgi:Transposase DDE domain